MQLLRYVSTHIKIIFGVMLTLMKNFSIKRVLVLLIPFLVVGFLAFRASSSPSYTAKIMRIPPANGKLHLKGEIDTKVIVTFRYSLFRKLKQRFIDRSSAQNGGDWYLIDQQNNRYRAFSNFKWTGWNKIGLETYTITYEFPLSEVPQSAGTLTLIGNPSDDKGWKLPVSVVVRRR